MAEEQCQVCRTAGFDRRTLSLRYLYDLHEASNLFTFDEETRLYSIRTCKGCRAVFLGLLSQWICSGGRLANPRLDENGNVEISVEEWQDRNRPL